MKMKKVIVTVTVILICLSGGIMKAQQSWQWSKTNNCGEARIGIHTTPLYLCMDRAGYIYLTGSFDSDSICFGNSTLYRNTFPGLNLFIVKFDPQSNVIWARTIFPNFYDYNYPTCISIDSFCNVYIGGVFEDTISFGNNVLTTSDNEPFSCFIVKYDSSGNVLWAKAPTGSALPTLNNVVVDAIGNAYITGGYSDSIVFDSITLIDDGNYNPADDIFLVKYDSGGHVLWAKDFGGIGRA